VLVTRQILPETGFMPIVNLSISDLSQDSIERSRPYLDPERVSYYLEHLDDSTPVVVFNVDGALLLADGHHRVAAAKELGRTAIAADVRNGRRRDALQFAVELAQHQRGLKKEQILEAIARRGQRPESDK
jgi:uncharacterized protein (DUF1015 family)